MNSLFFSCQSLDFLVFHPRVETTPKSSVEGMNVLTKNNSSTKNKQTEDSSCKRSMDANVPKEMEAPEKTKAGESHMLEAPTNLYYRHCGIFGKGQKFRTSRRRWTFRRHVKIKDV